MGGDGTDEIQITNSTGIGNQALVDADFTQVRDVEQVELLGNGSQDVDLGPLADVAGIVKVDATNARLRYQHQQDE